MIFKIKYLGLAAISFILACGSDDSASGETIELNDNWAENTCLEN